MSGIAATLAGAFLACVGLVIAFLSAFMVGPMNTNRGWGLSRGAWALVAIALLGVLMFTIGLTAMY